MNDVENTIALLAEVADMIVLLVVVADIGGVHLWGKRLSDTGRKVSHCGDLNPYFGNELLKQHFLETFSDCFNDGVVRKMVLEVNSGNSDLLSIITDLKALVFSSFDDKAESVVQ